jgi:dihydrofolate synthase / folylpolyglutamate synthase
MTEPGSALTYRQALRALEERGRFGIRLGLGRTRALLRELDHPERSVRGALIGGTNGKGSVVALAGAALQAAGYRVATAPKPHLVTYRERIQIDGKPVEPDDFARLVGRVLVAADRIAPRFGEPTEFELLTAVVFARFAEVRPDVALVEVGLGGRLDATHAWDGGVAVITNVDLDHMDRLGATIPLIAREKAAIIERGDLAVTGARGEGLAVIRRRARRLGVSLREVPDPAVLGWDRDALEVDLPGLGPTTVGLRGRHQAVNAAVAAATLDALAAAGIANVPDDARRTGFATAVWPGRLELIRARDRDVLLDGAHNPAGAAALARTIGDLRPWLAAGPLTVVMAAMGDKDVDGVIAALADTSSVSDGTVIATAVDSPRAMPPAELAARWSSIGGPGVEIEANPIAALERALTGTGPIVVAGSLYLVGVARSRLLPDPALVDPDRSEDR